MTQSIIRISVSLGILLMSPLARGQSPDFTAAATRSVLSLLVVLAIIIAIAYLVRKVGRTKLAGGSGDDPIRFVGQRALGTREKLVLVELDGSRILLGISHGTITTLHSDCYGRHRTSDKQETNG